MWASLGPLFCLLQMGAITLQPLQPGLLKVCPIFWPTNITWGSCYRAWGHLGPQPECWWAPWGAAFP